MYSGAAKPTPYSRKHRVAPMLFVSVRPCPVDTRAAPPVGAVLLSGD